MVSYVVRRPPSGTADRQGGGHVLEILRPYQGHRDHAV